MLDPGSDTNTTNQWGAVSFVYGGPEYIYATDFGLYAAGSIGLAGEMSTRKNDDDKGSNLERGSAGAAGMLSLGYQWRANKWFALNADLRRSVPRDRRQRELHERKPVRTGPGRGFLKQELDFKDFCPHHYCGSYQPTSKWSSRIVARKAGSDGVSRGHREKNEYHQLLCPTRHH